MMSEIESALDDPNVNVDNYFKSFIKNKKIDELISADNKLFTEVRNLESEKHVLVTQNYKKFVSATETINTIKNSLVNFEGDLLELKGKINNLVSSFKKINEPLEGKLKETQEIYKVKKDLKRLKFINDLPSILSTHLNMYLQDQDKKLSTLETPLAYYEKCKEFLKIHKDNNLVRDIYNKTKDLIYKYKTYINDEMNFPEFNEYKIEKFEKCLELLVKIEDDKSELIKVFTDRYQYLISCKFDKLFATSEGVEEITFEMYNKIYDNYEFAINESDFLFYESELSKKDIPLNSASPSEQEKKLELSFLPPKYFKKGTFIWICKKICEEILSKFIFNIYESLVNLFGKDNSGKANTFFRLCISAFYQKIKNLIEKKKLDPEFFRDGICSFVNEFNKEVILKIKDEKIETDKFTEMIQENNKKIIKQYISNIYKNYIDEIASCLQGSIKKLSDNSAPNIDDDIENIKEFSKIKKDLYVNEANDFIIKLTSLFSVYSKKFKSLGIENFNVNKGFGYETEELYLQYITSLFGLFIMVQNAINQKFYSLDYNKYFGKNNIININNDGNVDIENNNENNIISEKSLLELKDIIFSKIMDILGKNKKNKKSSDNEIDINNNNKIFIFSYFFFFVNIKLNDETNKKAVSDKLFNSFLNFKKNKKIISNINKVIETETKESTNLLFDSLLLYLSAFFQKHLKPLFYYPSAFSKEASPATFRLILKKICFKIFRLKLDLSLIFADEKNLDSLKFSKSSKIIKNSGKTQLQKEMDRLNLRRMNVYGEEVGDFNTFLISLSKILLKMINEYVKLKKLSIFGYQQINIDMAFLKNFLSNNVIYIDKDNIIEGFYDEIMGNAKFNVYGNEKNEFANSLIDDIIQMEQNNFEKIKQ